jgi:hypothetical protein
LLEPLQIRETLPGFKFPCGFFGQKRTVAWLVLPALLLAFLFLGGHYYLSSFYGLVVEEPFSEKGFIKKVRLSRPAEEGERRRSFGLVVEW